ncbi:MAG: protease [Mycobacteriales bacterium]|jgi:protease-4
MTSRAAPLLLELDLTEPVLEQPPTDPVGWLQARRRTTMRALLDGLREAADDPRVRGLVAKVGGPVGLARAQEVRDAVLAFRASGKPAVAWAETFGEFAGGTVPYLLATGFGEIWLQPSGDVGLTGLANEVTFLRGALDKLGVQPEIARRHEYKNAVDRIVERGFTQAHREASARVLESAFEQVVDAIAGSRGLSAERVAELVDQAPLLSGEALEAGLIDKVGYRDEVYAALRAKLGEDVELRYLNRYQPARSPVEQIRKLATQVADRVAGRTEPVVALISGVGAIRVGHSGRGPMSGPAMGSATVSAALRGAARDDRVRAVVFRVDSPGGSYVASDTIWREVGRVRAAGKPVVVSMGEVAGSGGYFVAMGADLIVAEPGTITGSIGVFAGKPVITGLLDRVGLSSDAVQQGRRARMLSNRRPFDEDEWQTLERWLDHVYADFVGKVAAGRQLSTEQVHEVARGRIWTGADARERGLVDELGGLRRATVIARERAGLPADATVLRWPAIGPLDRVRPPRNSESPAAGAGAYTAGWGSMSGLAARLGLAVDGPLLMPPIRVG